MECKVVPVSESNESSPGNTHGLNTLIGALQDHTLFDHPVQQFEVIETHISYVLLTGSYAYKFKKSVNLGFLDFSTLERRKFYCDEELRLNQRLAPDLYVKVIAITGSVQSPRINGPGPIIEFAVKMVQFPQDAQLDRVLGHNGLQQAHMDALAAQVASFHKEAAVADHQSRFGEPNHVRSHMLQNFEYFDSGSENGLLAEELHRLYAWCKEALDQHDEDFRDRKRQGRIREGHGDMHLTNMVLMGDSIVIFDCIEFNEALRWIDVISEIAFLIMDLDYRERADLGRRFLNTYLQHTGDYSGLRLMRLYLVYRSLVRAKIAHIQWQQSSSNQSPSEAAKERYLHHLRLAMGYTEQPAIAPLVITRGLSGSGKTTVAVQYVAQTGAIQLRSDVERKRLHNLPASARTGSRLDSGIYSAEESKRIYHRLAELAQTVLQAGYPVIVDAAFLKKAQRREFRELADSLGVPFAILDCQATDEVLRQRIQARQRATDDASEADVAVLQHQIETQEPLDEDEQDSQILLHTDAAGESGGIVNEIDTRLAKMTGSGST